MNEKNSNLFYPTNTLRPTKDIEARADSRELQRFLEERFPGDRLQVTQLRRYEAGAYRKGLHRYRELPAFYQLQIAHCTGRHTGCITVWCPVAWNDRFVGCPGGGIGTGGENYIAKPNNTSRGMTLPKGVLNGFTAATTDAGNPKREWGLDPETGKRDWERLENWHGRSTHVMTEVGKAVAEHLHGRPVRFSYLHGGSGGGRQSLVEAQAYPGDYDGIWASCPAINWNRFLPMGLWFNAVMNTAGHILTEKKLCAFTKAAQDSVGGPEAYYRRMAPVCFDPQSMLGVKTPDGEITQQDIDVVRKLWAGPRRSDGTLLWHSFRPGVVFWNTFIPVGAFYYRFPDKKPRPFFLSTYYLRWVTQQPGQTFETITEPEFAALFDQSVSELAAIGADKADLSAFFAAGGKLMIDHGIDDPLIPVDGTLDYYQRLCRENGNGVVEQHCRLYITPGDGHGTCQWHGPGITECDGMRALLAWVEQDQAPGQLRTVQVNRAGEVLQESVIAPYTEEAV